MYATNGNVLTYNLQPNESIPFTLVHWVETMAKSMIKLHERYY